MSFGGSRVPTRANFLLLAASLLASLSTSPVFADQLTFTIGVSLDLTGTFASFGRPASEGVEMAIKTWKRVKGDSVGGRKLKIIYKDVQSNSQVAVSAVTELINNESVNLLIGPEASNIAAAVVPTWKRSANHPIWLEPAVTSTKAEALIGDDPYFFHGSGWAYAYSESIVGALNALLDKDHRRVAILYSDGSYGRSQEADAKEALAKAGFDVVDEELMREGSPDIGSLIFKLRRAKPDVIYVLVQTDDAVQVTKQFYIAKLDAPFLIGTAQTQLAEWQSATGAAQSCWMGMTPWLPGLTYPADEKEPALFPSSGEWEAAYKKDYDHAPNYLVPTHYAMTLLALLAADRAGSGADRGKIAQVLASSEYMTPIGPAKFAPSHIAKYNTFIEQLLFQRQPAGNGEFHNVVVYPERIATGKPVRCKS